jgi:hypothetical protein
MDFNLQAIFVEVREFAEQSGYVRSFAYIETRVDHGIDSGGHSPFVVTALERRRNSSGRWRPTTSPHRLRACFTYFKRTEFTARPLHHRQLLFRQPPTVLRIHLHSCSRFGKALTKSALQAATPEKSAPRSNYTSFLTTNIASDQEDLWHQSCHREDSALTPVRRLQLPAGADCHRWRRGWPWAVKGSLTSHATEIISQIADDMLRTDSAVLSLMEEAGKVVISSVNHKFELLTK